VTDQRETTDQLDLFRQPLEELRPFVREEAQAVADAVARRTQMTELAGETWEDAFGNAA
jgi:hypothetical protein